MLSILTRCVQRGLLSRSDHGFTVVPKTASDLSFFRERDSYNRKERELIQRFIEYAQSEFHETVDVLGAETAMLDFLRRFDIDILISNDGERSALPDRPKGRRNRRNIYIFSRFVLDAYQANSVIFRTLCDMALGHMVTAAVLHDGYDFSGDTVRGVNIYIDAPIILRIIGTSGPEQAANFVQLVSELRERGAKLWVFEHSRLEALQILQGARVWVGRTDFDPTLASRTALYFRQQGFGDSKIEMLILKLDESLNGHGIKVFRSHPYMGNRIHQVDEERLRRVIEGCYSESNGRFDRETHLDRTLKDVASLAAVVRLREGRQSVAVKDAGHVFLSNNNALAWASREAVGDGGLPRAVPVCVTDVFLGTLVWIGAPGKARDSYQNRLIAECYAAISPDAALEAGIVREAHRLREEGRIGEDDYMLLTMSFVTRDLLSEKTLGDPEALDSQTTLDVLEGVKDAIRGETRLKVRQMELQNAQIETARRTAEEERDFASAAIAAAAGDYGDRWAAVLNSMIAIGIGATLILSVFGAVLIHAASWAISVTAVLVTGYLSFFKGFTLPKNFCRLRTKYAKKYRLRYHPACKQDRSGSC